MELISLNMIVKNEAKVLSRCLDSVKDIVDEIIIVDTGSEDGTIEIARSYGAKIFTYKWNNNFADARNHSLTKSTCNWHLVMDADEFIIKGSKEDFSNLINAQKKQIGLVRRIDKFLLNGIAQHSQVYLSRVFPKGLQYNGLIHEQIQSNLPKEKLPIEIYHDGYYLQNKTERNITLLEAIIQEEKKVDPYYHFQIAKEYRLSQNYKKAHIYYMNSYQAISEFDIYKPLLVVDFIYNIISGRYFEEGLQIINHEKNKLTLYPDFHFVCGLFYMEFVFSNIEKNIKYFPLIEREYLNALEIGDTDTYDSVIGTGSFLAAYNLGNFYEVTGQIEKAKEYYRISAGYNYQLAIDRLSMLSV